MTTEPTATEADLLTYPAGRHTDTGAWIDHTTGEPVEGVEVPDPQPGLSWTNQDIQDMKAGRSPQIARPAPAGGDETEGDALQAVDLDLSARSSNTTSDGTHHFARVTEGEPEVCGGCGKPWPCEHASLLQVAHTRQLSGQPTGDATDAAARLLGVNPEKLRAALGATE